MLRVTEPKISGRGNGSNQHPGNIRFRQLVASVHKKYISTTTSNAEKIQITDRIIHDIKGTNPPGSFFEQDDHSGMWIIMCKKNVLLERCVKD